MEILQRRKGVSRKLIKPIKPQSGADVYTMLCYFIIVYFQSVTAVHQYSRFLIYLDEEILFKDVKYFVFNYIYARIV